MSVKHYVFSKTLTRESYGLMPIEIVYSNGVAEGRKCSPDHSTVFIYMELVQVYFLELYWFYCFFLKWSKVKKCKL